MNQPYDCPYCGAPNPADANFCRMCGKPRQASSNLGVTVPLASVTAAPSAVASSSIAPTVTYASTSQPARSSYVPAPALATSTYPTISYGSTTTPTSTYMPQPSYASFVSQPNATSLPLQPINGSFTMPQAQSFSAQPGESWEQGGCRYRMGDRYRVDAQGHKSLVTPSSSPMASMQTGISPHESFVAPTGSPSTASSGLRAGRYPGGIDHMHDLHPAHVIPGHEHYHGPLPPNSAPGTPAMLPPYMQHADRRDENPRKDRKQHKKEKKDKESKRKEKKSCCG